MIFWANIALLVLLLGLAADDVNLFWPIWAIILIGLHVLGFYLPPMLSESHNATPAQHETATPAENGNETDS